jgi:hypothetical protein
MTRERWRAVKKHLVSASRWTTLKVVGTVITVLVTLFLTGVIGGGEGPSESSGVERPDRADDAPAAERDPFDGGMQAGYGPDRVPFRCRRPSECDGPKFVTFNSYWNAVDYGDERAFFDVKRLSDGAGTPWHDWLRVQAPTTLLMRAYIDNNTYQSLPGKVTDAIDTRLRLELPDEPVYAAHPTVYLRAENAKPQVIWDTVFLYGSRPMRMTYVPGSAEITRREDGGPFETGPAPEGLDTAEGMDLGRWKADFVNSALVTFRVRISFLPEPVQDPRATWQEATGTVRVVAEPPARSGPLREPEMDSDTGARFHCGATSCAGPPYVALNAYEDHPLLGDEADFLRAEPQGTYGDTGGHRYASAVQVRPGDRLYVRVSIDNGADPEAIGAPPPNQLLARDIRVKVMLPAGPATSQSIVAFIESPNAEPTEITDTLPIVSDRPVRIRYSPGTAVTASSQDQRRLRRNLFALSDEAVKIENWGATIPDLPPSFSRVTYVGFTIIASPA